MFSNDKDPTTKLRGKTSGGKLILLKPTQIIQHMKWAKHLLETLFKGNEK